MKATCSECSSTDLRISHKIPGVGYFPLLAKLGSLFHPPTVKVVLCTSCGLIRMYADQATRISAREAWRPLNENDPHSAD